MAGPSIRTGFWCTEESERSSNHREFRNLLEGLKFEAASGGLAGCEVWIFTDNQVSENVYYKGTSIEEELFELNIELKETEIKHNFQCRIVHIAGTRMIQEGTDGGSRGEIHIDALLDVGKYRVPLGDFACK
jgi:hypothetical protein